MSSVIQVVTQVTQAGENPLGVCKQQVINKNVILQCFRSLFGNLFTFFKFEGKSQIDRETRHQVIYVLGGVAAASVFAFLMLRDSKSNKNRKEGNEERGPLVELKKTWSIFLTKEMLILNLTFCFTGKHNRTTGQKQHNVSYLGTRKQVFVTSSSYSKGQQIFEDEKATFETNYEQYFSSKYCFSAGCEQFISMLL